MTQFPTFQLGKHSQEIFQPPALGSRVAISPLPRPPPEHHQYLGPSPLPPSTFSAPSLSNRSQHPHLTYSLPPGPVNRVVNQKRRSLFKSNLQEVLVLCYN